MALLLLVLAVLALAVHCILAREAAQAARRLVRKPQAALILEQTELTPLVAVAFFQLAVAPAEAAAAREARWRAAMAARGILALTGAVVAVGGLERWAAAMVALAALVTRSRSRREARPRCPAWAQEIRFVVIGQGGCGGASQVIVMVQ